MTRTEATSGANGPARPVGQYHSVEFSIKGLNIPYKFRIHNIDSNPMCVVVKKNSDILPWLKVGGVLNTRYYAKGSAHLGVQRKTAIRDIIADGQGRSRDHFLVSLRILDDPPNPFGWGSIGKMNREAWMEEGRKFYESGHYRKSIDAFSHAINLSPNYPLAYFNRAISWSKLENHQRALDDLRSAARLGFKKAQEYLSSRHVTWLSDP